MIEPVMIPIYFPHTYLSHRVMQILPAVFDRIAVYLPSGLDIPEPMQRRADGGQLELRIPAAGDAEQLAAVLKNFRSWAALQGGGPGFDLSLLKSYQNQPPFFDAPFASQIRTDIRQRMTPQPSGAGGPATEAERLLRARVFLSIAQQLDEQADALDRDYSAVDARQQDLLRELHGDRSQPPPAGTAVSRPDGHQRYMLAERLQAWAQLAAADAAQGRADAPALLVTASPEVFELVVEQLPEGTTIDRPGTLLVSAETDGPTAGWRRDFLQALTSLAFGRQTPADLPAPPPPAPEKQRLQLEVIRIMHRRIVDLPGGSTALTPASAPAEAAPTNTVIVAVEPAG